MVFVGRRKMRAVVCPRCAHEGAPDRPGPLGWVVVVGFWSVVLLFGACAAILLPLNLLLVPGWLAVASTVGPLARRWLDPRCAACGEVLGSSPARAPAPLPERRQAHARAVERGLV